MFSEKREKLPIVSERNVVGKNTSIVGNVNSEGDFRIDGSVEGNIKTAGKVVIGEYGCVKGEIECDTADIEGKFTGELKALSLLSLKSKAVITGNVYIGKLSVEPGAEFNATCTMKGVIKEMNHGQSQQEKSVS
ncbi:polymer-forming cytoskeletal protein [Lutibacter sp.]|uniref:bactofilin family protein n=1 Tax=Lutibacter sp. TaxID=1925666 RepID=UPI00273266A0|nr:polymer-forming cytoskeletal protein [Lutibacter sp.]MDP3313184.1 polymer-forming cytoskeletal protein [Lutibacter sp.]